MEITNEMVHGVFSDNSSDGLSVKGCFAIDANKKLTQIDGGTVSDADSNIIANFSGYIPAGGTELSISINSVKTADIARSSAAISACIAAIDAHYNE